MRKCLKVRLRVAFHSPGPAAFFLPFVGIISISVSLKVIYIISMQGPKEVDVPLMALLLRTAGAQPVGRSVPGSDRGLRPGIPTNAGRVIPPPGGVAAGPGPVAYALVGPCIHPSWAPAFPRMPGG